jgi:DNA processing protein
MNSTINYQNFKLFYKGDLSLLDKPKIAIVGSRRPTQYTKEITSKLSSILSKKYVIVSGGAMGVDAIAHKNAKSTIMVSPAGIDIIYPKINKTLIENIINNHLLITEYEEGYKPRPYSFVQRNRIVVGISEFIIITQADIDSGSMKSFEIAKKLNKKVYVIPHRIGDSKGTNHIASIKEAEVIWDIKEFAKSLGINEDKKILDYNEAIRIYKDKLFEMELLGEVEIKDAKVYFN